MIGLAKRRIGKQTAATTGELRLTDEVALDSDLEVCVV